MIPTPKRRRALGVIAIVWALCAVRSAVDIYHAANGSTAKHAERDRAWLEMDRRIK